MTNSKAPWLTRGGAIALMAAAAIALAACSGGGGLNEDEAAGLRGELEAAQLQATADAAARVTAEAKAALALAAKETAEAEATAARTDQEAAETAQRLAEETADGKVSDAEAVADTAKMAAKDALDAKAKADAALIVAQDKQKQAEDDRDAAVLAEEEAQRQLRLALAATTAEERRRQAAEAEQDRLEQVAEDAQQQVDQASSRTVLLGLGGLNAEMASTIGTDDPDVTPRYRAAASVTGTTGVTFVNPTTGSQGRWFRTSFSNRGESFVDRMDVYTDVDAATSVPFKDSRYNVDNAIVNAEGEITNRLGITGARDDVAGTGFPRSSGPVMSYDLDSRGMTMTEFTDVQSSLESMDYDGQDDGFTPADRNTQAFRDALEALGITVSQYNQYVSNNGRGFRNTDLYLEQWNAVVSGNLGGANGTYVCSSATRTTSCTVQNRGSNNLNFVGPWTFRPSSGTVRVRVDDSTYMHFGWWSRQDISDGSWSFSTFHGDDGDDDTPTSLVQIGEITDGNDVSGIATYQGPAVGYYAIYQPLGGQSGHGDFSAMANLTADFDTNGLHGTIDQFQGHSDWSVTLNSSTIDGGNNSSAGAENDTDNAVSWKIGNRTTDGGSWEANFYSNLVEDDPSTGGSPENARNGVVPSGVAGTFLAEFQDTQGADIGRMLGAFGAHCRTGC